MSISLSQKVKRICPVRSYRASRTQSPVWSADAILRRSMLALFRWPLPDFLVVLLRTGMVGNNVILAHRVRVKTPHRGGGGQQHRFVLVDRLDRLVDHVSRRMRAAHEEGAIHHQT